MEQVGVIMGLERGKAGRGISEKGTSPSASSRRFAAAGGR